MTTPTSMAEERQLQQAIANSRVDRHRPRDGWLNIPLGPTFYPTVEEFEGNPVTYINKIRPVAEKYGICKVVPPSGWKPPLCVDMNSAKEFETKKQMLHRLQEGIAFDDGEDYCPSEYQKMANEMALLWKQKHYPNHDSTFVGSEVKENKNHSFEKGSGKDISKETKEQMSTENLERDYWDIVETQSCSVSVEYGNDIDTDDYWSGFPHSRRGRSKHGTSELRKDENDDLEYIPKFGTDEFYRESWWNLNNIPSCPGSVLRHVKVGINGINVPWLYFGCLFSTFCWHNEDNYLYSINYHHSGSPKQWYGVPGTRKDAEGLEKVFKNYLAMKMREVPDLLHHITTMISPRLLQQGSVPVYKILQNAGEFVITFPRAYHGGFSMGPNIGEAVNFATPDWIAHGADANERYRTFSRPAVFSQDRLTFTLANYVRELNSDSCDLLVKELQRVIEEELRLRDVLFEAGVRDVSDQVNLPKNRLDRLDEASADYDDKRQCFTCKYICFFSAVACECSQSRVSCLRHSHLLCQCPADSKYLMIWTKPQEMSMNLENAKSMFHMKRQQENRCKFIDAPFHSSDLHGSNKKKIATAPGALKDWQMRKNDTVDLTPVGPIESCPILSDSIMSSGNRQDDQTRYLVQPVAQSSYDGLSVQTHVQDPTKTTSKEEHDGRPISESRYSGGKEMISVETLSSTPPGSLNAGICQM